MYMNIVLVFFLLASVMFIEKSTA